MFIHHYECIYKNVSHRGTSCVLYSMPKCYALIRFGVRCDKDAVSGGWCKEHFKKVQEQLKGG